MNPGSTILSPGTNCERIAQARRVAFLVDGERYFAALASAIESAERSVLMIGWDFHSRMRLRRGEGEEELIALLERVVRRRRRLRVRLLGWDFAMIYALEREFLPLERFDRQTHRRIHFRLDDRHPAGASHHQKLVVIDDRIAFCGGLDATVCRWDTREHRAQDPRRNDPGFEDYGPFHDVQMLVDGEAARALGAVARQRWKRATGHRLHSSETSSDPWPAGVEADLRDVGVAIARTQPLYGRQPEVRHVERLYVDAIRAARHAIYLENQYVTASAVLDVLVERLRGKDPPEIVVVLPSTLSGWLEERTMGALMARAVDKLREADAKGRLRVYVPVLPGDVRLTIHAKLMLVDDRFVRIGSANVSNRSMGFDTECDLAVETASGSAASRTLVALRNDLLAEHLGTRPEAVAQAIERSGSLLAAIESLRGGERSLAPYETEGTDTSFLAPRDLFDPEEPIPYEELHGRLAEELELEAPDRSLDRVARVAAGVALPLALLALWKLTPLAEWVSPESLLAAASFLDASPWGGLVGLGVFVVAAVLLVPVVSLIVAASLIFGFLEGSGISLVGAALSSAAGYGLGRMLWRDAVRKLAGARLDRLNERLASRGLLATAVVRIVPVAPFAIVNMVAGASHVRFRDFMLGTLIGMAPGTLALCFFGEGAAAVARDPSFGSIGLAVLGLAAVVVVGLAAQRLMGRGGSSEGSGS